MTASLISRRRMMRGLKAIGWLLLLLLCVAVAGFSARYLVSPPQTIKQALGNIHGLPWLVVHVAGSVTALVLGMWQFIPAWRKARVRPHFWIGRAYGISCLIGGVSGVVLALGTSAGLVAMVGFGLLGLGWLTTTGLGWRAAMQKRWSVHRRWMIRSWSLTLAAVTLRIYLPVVIITGLPFAVSYQVIAFLAWVPNLLLAEWWLRRRA